MSRPYPKTKTEQRKFARQVTAGHTATPNGTGVSVRANNAGYTSTVIKFTDTPIPMVDEAGVVAYGSLKVLDFPEGAIVIAGAVLDAALTKSSAGIIAAFDGDVGVGSAAAGNNAALAGTEQNVIPTTATPQAVAGVTTAKAASTAEVRLDGTAAAVDLFLNFLVDDADHDVTTTPANLIVNGTLTVLWANLGDK